VVQATWEREASALHRSTGEKHFVLTSSLSDAECDRARLGRFGTVRLSSAS